MRHGECQANVDGVYAGWNESPLTTSGSNAARNEAVRLRDEGRVFAAIYSSPLSRVHQTAVYIAEELGFDPNAIVDIDDLREKHNGTFEGRSSSELFAASDRL